jgi:hypothetical protein
MRESQAKTLLKKMEIKKMPKNSKRKLLFITFLFVAILMYNTYSPIVSNVHGATLTTEEKALAVFDNVVGLNVTAYTAQMNAQLDNPFYSLSQEEADLSFTSSQSKLRAKCSFVNNNLRQIYMSELNGPLYLNQATANTLEMAKSFMERYQQYTTESFYSELGSMLNNANINQNSTKIQGNIMLEVSVPNQARVNFIWTYADEHGVIAPLKNVVLSFENGMLKNFLDNWDLYKIAGKPSLSREEAIETALKAFENFSYEIAGDNGASTQTISKFKIESIGDPTICYLNYEEESSARSGDPFTLYPSWNIPFGFDKVYPGGVTSALLRIWADTGEVSSMKPMVSNGIPPMVNEKSFSQTLDLSNAVLLALLVTAVFVGATLYSVDSRKGEFLRIRRKGKLGSSLLLGSLLCLLLTSTLIVSAIPKVEAHPYGKADLDASMYGQLYDEKVAGTDLLDDLDDFFSDNGYAVTNARLSSTTTSSTVDNILGNASSSDQNYYRVAMFHFGHMAGNNTVYYDTTGDYVWDSDVSSSTNGKHFFVMLWTCRQADESDDGMPVAWTQNSNMAADGYSQPDYGANCFIGFSLASPGISNATGSFKDFTYPAEYFIFKFYYYALVEQYSVNDALNIASGEFFNRNYEDSPLYNGFETWWPYNPTFPDIDPGWYNGTMHVYGNGNLKLYQPQLTISAQDDYNNQLNPTFTIDGESVGMGSVRVAPGTHTFNVGSLAGHTFDHITFDYGSSQQPTTMSQ